MAEKIGDKAARSNPAFKPFEVLLGEWQTTGFHPCLPDVELHGRAVFEWMESGAFLMLRSEIDHPEFPAGIEIFGSDDQVGTYYMLHFDERGTSRKYDVSIAKNQFRWRRDDPKFSQRVTLTVEKDKLVSKGEMSRNGAAWEGDLSLTYRR